MSDSIEDTNQGETRSSGRATLVVMAFTGLSRILGFARIMVISAIFGGGAIADVLNAVFQIPNNLRKLLAEGALSTAFIPVLSGTVHGEPNKLRSEKLMASMFSFQVWILAPLMLICIIFAPIITGLLWEFSKVSTQVLGPNGLEITINQSQLAAQLFPWMMHYLVFVSFSAILMAILNVHNKFTIPALAPLMFSASVIAMLLILSQELYFWAQVLGVLVGGALQLGILVYGFLRLRYKVRLSIPFWRNPDFRKVLALMVPVLGSSLIFVGTETLATFLTSRMATGSTSALTNSLVFWQLPFGMFSASVTTVLFPKLSALIAKGDQTGLKSTLLYGMRLIMHLLIPSAILLILFGREIIAVSLQRGNFRPEDTALTAWVLQCYAAGMFFQGGVGYLQRFFYASKDHRIPLQGALLIGGIDVVLSFAALWLNWGVAGLAIASTVSGGIGFIWLLLRARTTLGGLKIMSLIRAFLVSLGACIPMAVIIISYLLLSGNWWIEGSNLLNWIRVIILILLSAMTVIAMYRLFKTEDFFSLLRRKRKEE